MGTRNSTFVQCDGEYKVAQYGQWDGYPEGVGVGVYECITRIVNLGQLEDFKDKVRALRTLTLEDVKARWKECGADDSGWVDMAVSGRFAAKWPWLSRDCAGDKVLPLIESGQVTEVKLDDKFPGDSLFCEWCYVIDLDAGTFEVYGGFNKDPLPEGARFYDLTDASEGYHPVRLLVSWPLTALPTRDEFLAATTEREEEELSPA